MSAAINTMAKTFFILLILHHTLHFTLHCTLNCTLQTALQTALHTLLHTALYTSPGPVDISGIATGM